MATYTDEKAIMSQNPSFRNLEQMNLSSRSPTRQYIVLRSQAIADQNYDASKKIKMCRKSSSTWYCWCFESTLSNDEAIWPMSALPRYRRVRHVTVKSRGNFRFLWCDCGFYDRIGIPCPHIFRVVGEMSLNMFHIRHWRYYEAYYNDPTHLGQQLVQAQKEHFDNEGMGVRLMKEQVEKITHESGDDESSTIDDNIIRASNTTLNDWADAKFVITKCTQGSCLRSELDQFIYSGRLQDLISPNEIVSFEGYRESDGFTSAEAKRLQRNLLHHSKQCNGEDYDPHFSCSESIQGISEFNDSLDICCTTNRDEIRKSLVSCVDTFLSSERVSNEMVNEFNEEVQIIYRRMMSRLKEKGSTQDNGEYEFACDEGIYRSPQKRKHNALDY